MVRLSLTTEHPARNARRRRTERRTYMWTSARRQRVQHLTFNGDSWMEKPFAKRLMRPITYVIIHWKRNIFLLPSGATGKSFIQEITHLLQAFASGSAMESIALKASFVMQVLLLQKPSKSRDLVTRRLEMWKQGDILSLTQEGRCIQRYLLNRSRPSDDDAIARNFGKMMEQGKVRAALRYLSRNTTGGVLSLDDMIPTVSSSSNSEPELRSTWDILEDKHPSGKSPDPSSLLSSSEPALFDRIIFENLNADTIHHAAMHTHGSAGPSGLDSYVWRRLCSSFGSVSHDLCSALAAVARRLCTTLVNQESISALVASLWTNVPV